MDESFETRYEWLRPGQLIARRQECPLIIVPLAPLEYHGPHLPLGTDPINATQVAHACCAKLRKGVVRPTLTVGTERERDPAMVESLGFEPGSYVVGMDFPSRLWNSHYLPEEVFALLLAAELRILVGQGYRYVFIANGHGAYNHLEVVRRLCTELSNTTPAKVDYHLTITREAMEKGWAGHADVIETSLMMYYDARSVDLGTLPPRAVPLHYKDFSICDGAAFSSAYDREHVVRHDCRDATAERGRRCFEDCVAESCEKIEKLLT
jgi:creatinine amidohydrolase